MFHEALSGKKIRCSLCAHSCIISEGRRGICGVRENRKGTLYSLVYGKLIAANVDPIEKKPLFHFLPGTTSFSVATVGCNFKCRHCQDDDIDLCSACGVVCTFHEEMVHNRRDLCYAHT